MKRILVISRPAFAVGILFLMAGVVALSVATRRPYQRAFSNSWHICKAGHLTESEEHVTSATQKAELADEFEAETETSPSSYLPCEEALPSALALIIQKHHFRSPPSLQ